MARTQETKSSGLKKWLARILAPPRSADDEWNRLARILNIILLYGLLASVVVAAATAASGQYHKTIELAAGGASTLLLLLLLRSGRLRSAIFLTFLSILALVTVLLYTGGGIHDLAAMLYPVIIVIAGLLLRPKEFAAIVLLAMLSATFIVLSEIWGLIAWSEQFNTTIYVLFNILAIFTLAAVPVRLLANDLRNNMTRVQENERQLRESNLKLQHEISERELADSALRESETRFRILADSTFEGLFISENDIIIDANSSLAKMFGCDIKEIIGCKVSDFLDRETAEIVLQQFKSESSTPYEHQLKRPDGTLIPVESRNKMIPYQGRMVRVTTIHDISERRRHEEEYRIMEAEIRQNQKLESLGTLAGGIAHDFNNIISIISGHAAALADKLKKHADARATLHTINEAAERGSAMVRQILTFARKSEADFRSLQIQELVNELVKMLRVTFPRTIEISHSCLQDLPPLWMDPSQLHQALLNLCINARDAMAGTGKLEIATSMIDGEEIACRFPAAAGKRLIHIRISDTGMGMDEATRARIFEPFFTTKGRGRGTGLGLAVVYGVVRAHSGFIEVDSQIGRGTSFSLYFSAAESPASLTAKADLDTGLIAGGSETILLVEDEEDLRELLAAVLHDQGYGILMARDGLEALERYRRHRGDIQLVITDMDLPKINGAAVCQAILSSDPKTKIILISGFLETALKNSILASGVREFLAKPYTMPQMLQLVRRVLDGN
ncbi:MAG: PAS domain-containing sensor histidine kinase [Chrysiogenales bacterium]|nr:MAG: PAS domain-containing sensor histidine kinase [Chrysiogenales bacterium]